MSGKSMTAALPQHIAVRLCLTEAPAKTNSGEAQLRRMSVESACHGKPEAFRYVLRRRRPPKASRGTN
jgi:hypothetical protein